MTEATASCPDAASTLVSGLREHLRRACGQSVELVETHVAWVLLAADTAYKLKKPVRYAFLNQSSLLLRKHACEEEVRLNRRTAASLYLDVVPVCGTAQSPRLGGEPAIDYVVRMRRFPAGALLREQLAAGRLAPEMLARFAKRLAEFHRQAAVAGVGCAFGAPETVPGPLREVLAGLRHGGSDARLPALERWTSEQAEALAMDWALRQQRGAVRECHGDLHLGNVVLLEDGPTAFDCIEFDPALRWIDVMSDVAFMTMDLKAHGRGDLAWHFLDVYLQQSGDYEGVKVLRFYEVYRALVRALVAKLGPAALAAGGPDYLGCAAALTAPAGDTARLMITHGVSGSGKSTVAAALVAAAGALRVRSDVERKRLFAHPGELVVDPYTTAATRSTYQRLAACARIGLQAGYPVIVDAAFLRRAERRAFRALATELRVPFTILHCGAPEAQLRRRVQRRLAEGGDASDATVEVLEQQLADGEALNEAERAFAIDLMTHEEWEPEVLAARWRAHRAWPLEATAGGASVAGA